MKAPTFWSKPSSLQACLLKPLGCLYVYAGKIRAFYIKPYKASIPVICVGNITAGGAGKTPTALTLCALIKEKKPTATPVFVTRGYGGQEKGPLRVDLQKHTAKDVGDEALLLAQEAPCWIGKDRAATVKEAEKEATHILLDDGLQNPTIQKDFCVLVIDGAAGLGNEHIIPAGPLRETLASALPRIDSVVLIGDDAHDLAKRIDKPIWRAHLRPHPPMGLSERTFFAFAGIGRPEKFYTSCRESGLNLQKTKDFPDHHAFSFKELQKLDLEATEKNLTLITTAKDYVRLPTHFKQKVSVLGIELIFDRPEDIKKRLP